MKTIIYFLFIFFLSSCVNRNEINQDTAKFVINIDSVKKKQAIKLSTFFDSVETIILETSGNALLSRINRLFVSGDSVFILNKGVSSSLFVFNRSGKYMGRIGNAGQGPGEYSSISDFSINDKEGIIYILDSNLQKINMYNMHNGSFIKEVLIPQKNNIRSFHLQYFDKSFYMDALCPPQNGDGENLLRKIRFDENTQDSTFLNTTKYNMGWNKIHFVNNVFYPQSNTDPKYIQSFMNTVMAITPKGVIPYLKFVSKDWLTKEELDALSGNPSERYNGLSEYDRIYNINSYCESNKYIYYEYNQGIKYNHLFYNKETSLISYAEFLVNDLLYNKDSYCGTKMNFCFADSMGVYAYIHPIAMNGFIDEIKNGYLSPHIDKLSQLKELGSEPNPILFYFKYSN